MSSRRQRQLAARKQTITSQQDLTRKKIFQNIDEKTKNTENIIARLRARLDVLDLVVDKSLPEDAFLARKEINPWVFRRNERLNNKWNFVNNMVTMQEFLVAASEARKRQEEACATSTRSNLQQMGRTSISEAVTTSPSKALLNQESDEEDYNKNAGDPIQRPPKEAITVRLKSKINQPTEQETPSVSDTVLKSDTSLSIGALESISVETEPCSNENLSKGCFRCTGEDNDTVLPVALIDDSQAEIDTKTNVIPETSDKDKLSSKSTPLLSGSNISDVEFFKVDINLNGSKGKLNLRPSLKPVSFSKFRAMARDLEKTLTFDWVPESGADICEYCSKSVCVGRRFKVYLSEKEKTYIRPLQAQPSEKMKQRIADVAAIYGLGYR